MLSIPSEKVLAICDFDILLFKVNGIIGVPLREYIGEDKYDDIQTRCSNGLFISSKGVQLYVDVAQSLMSTDEFTEFGKMVQKLVVPHFKEPRA